MNGMNGHDDLEKNKNASANSASFYQPALILLAGVSSFVSLIMVMALVIVTASTNPDCNAKVNNVLNASSVPSNTMDTCPSSAQPFPASGLDMVAMAYNNMGKDMLNGKADYRYQGLADQLKPIGWHQEMLCEASDAGDRTELVADGMSGDVDFPHSSFQPILTIGEYDAKSGYIPVGVPDGMGAYLVDMDTARLVFQAESYGHISGNPSWYLPVNDGKAKFTGSHITYVDYDKAKLHAAVEARSAIHPTVKGAGELFSKVYNLNGDLVDGAGAPHFGDTSVDGTFVSATERYEDEWTFHSFCSAHLEEAKQWGGNVGLEDSIFLTVEEWTSLDADKVAANGFVGLSAHAVDMAAGEMWAVGAFGMGGYEKIVEISCGVEGYACFAISGYNGNFGGSAWSALVDRKKAQDATRADGTEWVYPQNIVPARVYVGVKGYKVDGTACGADCSFLERNGLAHGKVYGFAVDDATPDRDAWHKNNHREQSPTPVEGVFAPTAWKWGGVAQDFAFDQAWDFQEPPVGAAGKKFWTAKGRDEQGSKTEHNTPDPRGNPRYMQGSTAGYMGIYDLPSLPAMLSGLAGGALPGTIPATYELIEGETDITAQIELGGKGIRADGNDQTHMRDSSADKPTFEDIDGLEWFAASDGDYILIQEDGGNHYGERTFLYKLPEAGVKPTYYFLAQSGGAKNTRTLAKVSIPPNTWGRATSHEFSGSGDFSGMFTQTTLGGSARRAAEEAVAINDKWLFCGLQAHTISEGVVKFFGGDRGGQIFAMKPNLPAA